ncbi:MAG: hypothetical protein PHU71_05735 [Candidatus Gracilibacteria bacterium]|nr:hypothetical protein [Candidatus Gracilibacteria bacterium]
MPQNSLTSILGNQLAFTGTSDSTSSVSLDSLYKIKKDMELDNNDIKCIKVTQKGYDMLKDAVVETYSTFQAPITGNPSFCGIPVEIDESVYEKTDGHIALEFDSLLSYLKYSIKNDIKQVKVN